MKAWSTLAAMTGICMRWSKPTTFGGYVPLSEGRTTEGGVISPGNDLP